MATGHSDRLRTNAFFSAGSGYGWLCSVDLPAEPDNPTLTDMDDKRISTPHVYRRLSISCRYSCFSIVEQDCLLVSVPLPIGAD